MLFYNMTNMMTKQSCTNLVWMVFCFAYSSIAYGEEQKSNSDSYLSAVTWNPLTSFAIQDGMDTLDSESRRLVIEGKTTIEEITRVL